MYYPFLRGKQQELLLIRDYCDSFHDYCRPIIEPVKLNPKDLLKATKTLKDERLPFIVIINPTEGDFKNNPSVLKSIWDDSIIGNSNCMLGIIMSEGNNLSQLKSLIGDFPDNEIAIIHKGIIPFTDYNIITKLKVVNEHIFCLDSFPDQAKLVEDVNNYNGEKIAIKDGFIKKSKNKLYPLESPFSDLHKTYKQRFTGFGDFLVEGINYKENGGGGNTTAEMWAVVHLSMFIDEKSMEVKHYLSDSNTQDGASVAEMILECFGKIVSDKAMLVDTPNTLTSGIKIIEDYYQQQKQTNFAKLKYISFIHHIDLMKHYLKCLEG